MLADMTILLFIILLIFVIFIRWMNNLKNAGLWLKLLKGGDFMLLRYVFNLELSNTFLKFCIFFLQFKQVVLDFYIRILEFRRDTLWAFHRWFLR